MSCFADYFNYLTVHHSIGSGSVYFVNTPISSTILKPIDGLCWSYFYPLNHAFIGLSLTKLSTDPETLVYFTELLTHFQNAGYRVLLIEGIIDPTFDTRYRQFCATSGVKEILTSDFPSELYRYFAEQRLIKAGSVASVTQEKGDVLRIQMNLDDKRVTNIIKVTKPSPKGKMGKYSKYHKQLSRFLPDGEKKLSPISSDLEGFQEGLISGDYYFPPAK